MVSGGVLSLPTLRLRADYFAITTIAISEIVDYVATNYQSLTGGPLGTTSLGGPLQVTEYNGSWVSFQADVQGWLHDLVGGYANSDFALLVIVWVILLACLLVVTPMVRSPWGRVLRAIREDEDAAAALGKPVYWYKLQSLAIGAGFGAIAGLLYAFEFQNFAPTDFDPLVTFYGWLIVLISGAGRIWAVPVGALIFGFIFSGPHLPQLQALHLPERGAARLPRDDDHRGDPDRADGLAPAGALREARGDGARVSALLEVRDVVKHYGGVVAVSGATLDVEEGSITGLIGPNGAGKTTLFNIISGFRHPEQGSVRFAGERIERRSPHRVARTGLVRTFQQTKALTRMTVLDNMMLAGAQQPGEHLWRLALSPRAVAPARARGRGARARAARGRPPRAPQRRVRGHALGRPAQAARVRARAHGRAAHGDARRADGGRQPDARAAAARARAGAARLAAGRPSC